MARPKVSDSLRRRHQTKVLFSDEELERENARRGERTISEFLRSLALASPARADRAAEAVAIADPVVGAEVAEARMSDEPAREAFIERRTQELYGAGNTSRVARRLAEAEWRARGG